MINILLISANAEFKSDIEAQIARFVSDVKFSADLPDIVIVDEDEEIYDELKQKYKNIPFILLSANKGKNGDKLNIFFAKPFRLIAFLDILRSANNHLDNSAEGCLVFNNYSLSPTKRELTDLLSNMVYKLTEKEVDIIKYLYKNPADFVSKNVLQTNVWGYHEEAATHTIETHIYRLRQKIEKDSFRSFIITENGSYKLKMD